MSNLTPLLPTPISSLCLRYWLQAAHTKGETKVSVPPHLIWIMEFSMMGIFMSWMSSLSDGEIKSCQQPKAYVGLTHYHTEPETLEESKILLLGHTGPVDIGWQKNKKIFCAFTTISHLWRPEKHLFKESLKGKENSGCQHTVSCEF